MCAGEQQGGGGAGGECLSLPLLLSYWAVFTQVPSAALASGAVVSRRVVHNTDLIDVLSVDLSYFLISPYGTLETRPFSNNSLSLFVSLYLLRVARLQLVLYSLFAGVLLRGSASLGKRYPRGRHRATGDP